jgi:hypothetical protein
MKTAMLVLALALVLAVSASAQFTVVVSTDANSNGSTVHESAVLSYTPWSNCYMCYNAFHTWQGTLMDSLSGRSCGLYWNGPATSPVNTGCALDIPVGFTDQTFTSTLTLKGICSIAGLFFGAVVQLPKVNITFGWSAYRNTGCIALGGGTYWCTTIPSGRGCPSKCTTATGKVVLGTPLTYSQCEDTIVNGNCTLQICDTQSFQGFCK